jgi:hypothetical protein
MTMLLWKAYVAREYIATLRGYYASLWRIAFTLRGHITLYCYTALAFTGCPCAVYLPVTFATPPR